MNPLISIITPTYNHEAFIAECIQSVLGQDYQEWEMLIVNDGSTDGTAKIAEEYAVSDSRIKVYSHENFGIFRLAENYNFALAQTRGKYIAILEGDDIWERDKLSRQVAVLEKVTTNVLAWSPAIQVNVDQSLVFQNGSATSAQELTLYENTPVGSILNILFFRNCIPALTVLIRKEALLRINGFHQGYGLPLVDIPTLQLLSTLGPFYYDPKPTGRWRVYPDQVTKTHLVKIFAGCYQLSLNNRKAFSHDKNLTFQVSRKDIVNHFEKILIMAYARQGRYCLIKRQFSEARKYYRTAIFKRKGEYLWKFRAVVGLLFSYFHVDIEWLAKALNRPSYKR